MPNIGWGGTLTVNDGAADAHVAIPDITTLTPPADETQIVESRTLGMTGRRIRKVKSLIDPGAWQFQVEANDALYTRLIALRDEWKEYIVTTSDGTVITVDSLMTKCARDPITPGEIQTITCDLTVDGPEDVAEV